MPTRVLRGKGNLRRNAKAYAAFSSTTFSRAVDDTRDAAGDYDALRRPKVCLHIQDPFSR